MQALRKELASLCKLDLEHASYIKALESFKAEYQFPVTDLGQSNTTNFKQLIDEYCKQHSEVWVCITLYVKLFEALPEYHC